MKKQLLITLCISALMLCSCGNNKSQPKENEVNTDSLVTECSPKNFTVTKEGVGSLKKNKPFVDMSQSDEGLYDKVKKEPFYDEPSGVTFDSYTLYLDDVEVATFMTEKPTLPIESLTITSPYASLSNGIKVGMLVKDVLDKEGVTASASFDDMGDTVLEAIISISFEGVELNGYYWGNGELTESGMKKVRSLTMENYSADLNKSDFKPESKIPGFYLLKQW